MVIALMMSTIPVMSQSEIEKPVIGKPMPDYTFNNVTHYKSKSVSISSFRGKWLFLDFWSNGCGACIKSFPALNDFQKEFRGQLNWVLVGRNDLEFQTDFKAIERLYEKRRAKQGLELISAYDSVLFNRWNIPFVPCIYVIDPQGTLKYITDGQSFSSQSLRDLFSGSSVNFYDISMGRRERVAEDLCSNGNVIYKSLLTRWTNEWPGVKSVGDFATQTSKEKGYLLTKCSLSELYNAGYLGDTDFRRVNDPLYGSIYSYPRLEMEDSTLFESDMGFGKGMYNYFLLIPPERATRENIMLQMQDDLQRIFGYDASVEVRDVPVWKLIAGPTAGKHIRTTGGKPYNSTIERVYAAGFWVRNRPFKEFFWALISYLSGSERAPFIDATGIDYCVDISIDADLTLFQDVQSALKKYDLQLVRDVKKMKVVVIRDKAKLP
jgi:thiol-disulfide isomerase/thioredoxin